MVMRSRGIEYTLVNGEVTWERGALTGAAKGEVLRSVKRKPTLARYSSSRASFPAAAAFAEISCARAGSNRLTNSSSVLYSRLVAGIPQELPSASAANWWTLVISIFVPLSSFVPFTVKRVRSILNLF